MPTSTSRLSYPDCEAFLDRALEDDVGARVAFQLIGHAQQFLVRCNTFRSICRDDNRKIFERGDPMHGRCQYDPLSLSVIRAADDSEYFVYARRYQLNESDVESLSEIEKAAE